MKKKVLANATWLTGARLLGDALSFVLFVIISREYGPEGVGQYSYAFALGGILFAFVNFGVEDYAVRECSIVAKEQRAQFMSRLIFLQWINLIIVSICLFLYLFNSGISEPEIKIISFLAIYHFILAFVRTLFSPSFAEQNMLGPAISELGSRIFAIISAIVAIKYFDSNLQTALFYYPVSGLLLLLFAIQNLHTYSGKVTIRFDLKDLKKDVVKLWPFAASVAVLYLYSRVDLIMIKNILGDTQAGIYASAVKFLEVSIVPLLFLGVAIYPMLSSSFRDDKRTFTDLAEKFFKSSLVIGSLIAWGLMFVVPVVISGLFGEKFADSIVVVKFLAVLALLMAVDVCAMRIMLAMGLQVLRVKVLFFGTLLNIIINLVLIPMTNSVLHVSF